MAESLFRGVQSPDQLGFSKGMSYLMGALERGECQRHALDTKQTCFGISFDGKAALPSVDREIHSESYTAAVNLEIYSTIVGIPTEILCPILNRMA